MNRSRIAAVICTVAAFFSLAACNKAKSPSASASKSASSRLATALKPIQFAGIDLRTVNRQKLEAVYFHNLNAPLVPRNDFESLADASKIFTGAEKVEVGFTRGGLLATMQFVFPGTGDPQLTGKVVKLMESQYGMPTNVLGKIEENEYRAVWDMGGDFIIQVGRGWPNTTTHLNFISGKNLMQLREDIQQRLNAPSATKAFGK